mmetsp:Transcript_11626/g.25165  ORF Transcript_11626/g.25165 Transcript_11626/m.25165 type:complete len:205 (+) Transcript_11626:1696-2310(+)
MMRGTTSIAPSTPGYHTRNIISGEYIRHYRIIRRHACGSLLLSHGSSSSNSSSSNISPGRCRSLRRQQSSTSSASGSGGDNSTLPHRPNGVVRGRRIQFSPLQSPPMRSRTVPLDFLNSVPDLVRYPIKVIRPIEDGIDVSRNAPQLGVHVINGTLDGFDVGYEHRYLVLDDLQKGLARRGESGGVTIGGGNGRPTTASCNSRT